MDRRGQYMKLFNSRLPDEARATEVNRTVKRRAANLGGLVRESPQGPYASGSDSLLTAVDARRRDAMRQLDPHRRALMGQFLTPAPVAEFMAGMVEARKPVLHIMD